MAIYLDFVGLNTLVYEPLTSSTNTIGYDFDDYDDVKERIALRCPSESASIIKNLNAVLGTEAFNFTGEASISCWVKTDDTSPDAKFIYRGMTSGFSQSVSNLYIMDNKVHFAVASATGDNCVYSADTTSTFTGWTNIVITYSVDEISVAPSLYVDNQEVTMSILGLAGSGPVRKVAAITLMGKDTASETLELQGSLRDFALYNKALTTSEISEAYVLEDIRHISCRENIIVYWRLGTEPNLYEMESSATVPSGILIAPTVGDAFLTASNNIQTTESGLYLKIHSNYNISTIPDNDHLVGLNIHRNGPYGYSSFKQMRSAQNPLTRYHNKNSIFSYVLDGNTVETNGREVFKPRRSQIRQVTESPIVSNNKPLTVVGGISHYNRRSGKTTIERVEVQASFNNEIQFFGDEQTNREFGLELETHETYEDLTELYLDGGIEADDSPMDQFELLRYQHQVYPREGNTYLGHVRGRDVEWEVGYWRDTRTDRTEVNSSEKGEVYNGFGFIVPSQSIWPLDVEEGWATRDLNSTLGSMTMSAPTEFKYPSQSWQLANASAIVLDVDGDGYGVGNDVYLYAQSADSENSDIDYKYDSSVTPPVGYIHKGRYRLNSSRGVTKFYNAWTELMEDAGFRIESTSSSIPTRNNINAVDTTYASSDPYYLEIDNVADAAHFTTELSHSLVHFWTKNESGEKGYIYSEFDSLGGRKRAIKSTGWNYYVQQTANYEIVEEDGTITIIIGNNGDQGLLQYTFQGTEIEIQEGNEWNNKIIKFGNPHTEGSSSIAFYSNGNDITPFSVFDDLKFFNSDGDMSLGHKAFDKTATLGLESNTYRKVYNPDFNLALLMHTTGDVFDFTANGQFGCSFYFMMDKESYSPSDGFRYKLITLRGNDAEMYVEIYTYFVSSYKVLMKIYVEDSDEDYSFSVYDITGHWNKMTKYLILDSQLLSYPILYTYVIEDRVTNIPTRYSSGSVGTQKLWANDVMNSVIVYDQLFHPPNPEDSDDGAMIADLLFLTGALANHYTPESVLNGGATVDYTASYWTGGEPLGWWRFNVDNEDPSVHSFATNGNTQIQDRTSNALDLSGGFISFLNKDGPPRQKIKPLGFHTASIGEAYVLCKTSSTNNVSGDYFQDAKVAEFALIPSKSNTDITEYISSPFYQFTDLTSSALTVTASVWYSFENTDEITENGANIVNQNTALSTFALTGTYASAVNFPTIENDGLVITSSTSNEIEFRIRHDYMNLNTSSQEASSTGILNYVSSSIIGSHDNFYIGGALGYNAQLGPGVLMNSYNSFNKDPPVVTEIDNYLSAACLYTRRHTLVHSSSFQHPFVSLSYENFFQPGLKDYDTFNLYQGMAFWDAPAQSGKKPFYDTYGAYAAEMRLTNKDYSVVPEYKVSDHIDKFLLKGDTQFTDSDNPMLCVTGGHIDKWNSDLDGFYETYSTTDFLKMFDLIQEEHDDFVNPISLKLKCKGVKKFLPYKGFYPADRTVEISQQFYSSYGENLSISSKYSVQNLLTPLFSPGILFNTIKSGVACDYPIMTGSFATSSLETNSGDILVGSYFINEQFHKRIPFEAIVEPEKYLANQPLRTQEPDPLGSLPLSVTWNGQGDEKYRLMVSNFLAETGDFFLRNKDYATIASLPEGDPNFGNVEAGKTYMMRIKMYRTIDGNKALWADDGENYDNSHIQPQDSFSVPQDTGSMEQAFMMYSRPSAFGPPQRITLDNDGSPYDLKFTNWSEYKRADSLDYFYKVSPSVPVISHTTPAAPADTSDFSDLQVDSGGHLLCGNDADAGYNYPFTPPYYHGDAWADITFTAEKTEKLTLSQIINASSVEFLRYYEPVPYAATHVGVAHYHKNWRLINEDAMQLASSINIFSKGVLKQEITQTKRKGIRNDVQVQVDTNVGNQYRWIIQSKFETPILNFNKYTHRSSDITMPYNSPHTTPVGMWHQYGELPQKPEEGVFLQVTDVPSEWMDNAMNVSSYKTGSLADLCGFSTDPVRLGDVAPTKTIKEAVVAIPFVERKGQKQFFTIDREDIQNALDSSTRNLVGKTVQDMVKRMEGYIFPPSMDFLRNDDIDPFAMYIFEFKHVLDKQDLADIWQNLPPDVGISHEEAEAVISHELLAHELLGGKADLKPGVNTEFELNRQVRKDKIDSKIRWMIFKVKQRGKSNYFEKIFERNESQESGVGSKKMTLSSVGDKKKIGYNWPYDYFSLVELIKMDAEIDFARPDDENQEEKLVIKPYTKIISNSANQSLINNGLFGTKFPEPEPPQGLVQERIPTGKKKRR